MGTKGWGLAIIAGAMTSSVMAAPVSYINTLKNYTGDTQANYPAQAAFPVAEAESRLHHRHSGVQGI